MRSVNLPSTVVCISNELLNYPFFLYRSGFCDIGYQWQLCPGSYGFGQIPTKPQHFKEAGGPYWSTSIRALPVNNLTSYITAMLRVLWKVVLFCLKMLVLTHCAIFRVVLKRIFDEVRVVDVMDSGDTAHLAMMKRPDLGVTFTKLHCWTLTHYSKCVFMDADTLVRGHT